jgi:hydrogenase assembly chaperone HypC/HupF
MCLGLPARVVSVGVDHPDLARVELGGVLRMVNVGLLDSPPAVGELILVHMGFALSTMTAQEAESALDVFRDERRAEAALLGPDHRRVTRASPPMGDLPES